MTDLLKQMAEALRHIENAATDPRIQRYEIRAAATEALAKFDAQAAEQAAGGGEAVPYCHVYEYDTPLGLHRALYPKQWNGKLPDRTVPVYTHPAPSPAPVQQVGELPPLPIEWRKVEDADGIEVPVFRAFQMWDYARAALSTRPELRRLAAEVAALREHAVTLANTTFLTTIERCAAICEAHYNHEAKDCAEEIRALKDQA